MLGPSVRLDNVSHAIAGPSRSTARPVLDAVTLDVEPGECVAVTGPSGCGKTTLIKLIAGVLQPTSGTITLDGRRVEGPGSAVVVFQDLALFDWMTAVDNVAFGLKARGLGRAHRLAIADEYLARVQMTGERMQFPYQLSGGMKQRLALARALAVDPACLLLDEPFSALDGELRFALQDELLRLWEPRRRTVILVTHDMDEAMYLADRVVIMGGTPGVVRSVLRVDLPRPRRPAMRPRAQEMARENRRRSHQDTADGAP